MNEKEKEKMEEKSGKKREKRPYEKPAFGSEELFEVNVLACGKASGAKAPCDTNPFQT